MRSLGNQIVAEFYYCYREHLDDVAYIQRVMTEAARAARATIVSRTFHRFSPHGVSGAVIIAESHLTIHTWPEHGYAAVDLFTCGERVDAQAAFAHLREALKAKQVSTIEIRRGQIDMMVPPVGDTGPPQLSLAQA